MAKLLGEGGAGACALRERWRWVNTMRALREDCVSVTCALRAGLWSPHEGHQHVCSPPMLIMISP